ncbi:MAG: hypothetical protein IIW01_10005 [Thermoguttaceae bacterium]|nr:hypothetical protein [Thermoguttaceae bacterium]MBQ5790611.1 hypothetical protein [Thermoguttaceae bacterium]
MEVMFSVYYEVIDGDGNVVFTTSDEEAAQTALPVDGEIYEVMKTVVSSEARISINIEKEVVKRS